MQLRINIKIVGTAIGTFALTWWLFASLYRPSGRDFLITATSYYFKRMSEEGNVAVTSFRDCIVQPGDDRDLRQGILMYGLCRAESESAIYHYSIAMSPTTNYIYEDLEEVENGGKWNAE